MDPLKKFSSFNPTKHAFTLLDEFKEFAFKGNVIDLAIGVIIAGAFGKIIDSLVKNIIMPSIGLLFPGDQGYLGWKFIVHGREIPYGLFIGEVVNFILVASALCTRKPAWGVYVFWIHWMFCLVCCTELVSWSMPMTFTFLRSASCRIVPDPQKGSSRVSPGLTAERLTSIFARRMEMTLM